MIVIFFLSSIVAANVAVAELDPVPVWPGVYAPAGVYLVALTLVLRDLVQRFNGGSGVFWAFVGGMVLSVWLASPEVATASLAAFAVSFLIDTAIFTFAMRAGLTVWGAVLISGLVSLVPDTLVFLHLAGLEQFIPGQLIGKLWGTLAAVLVFALSDYLERRRRVVRPCVIHDGYCFQHHTSECDVRR